MSDNAANEHPKRNQKTPFDLPEYWREHYEERAAIREHEGKQPCQLTDAEALGETRELMQTKTERSAPASSEEAQPSATPLHPNAPRLPGELCPACGGPLVPESGCWYCPRYGFSKCG